MKNSKETSKTCIECQKCCKQVGVLSVYPFEPYFIEFYKARGAIIESKTIDNEEYCLVIFNIPCPHLDTKIGCKIYENRPQVCKDYPIGDDVIDGCQLKIRGEL